MTSRRQKKQKRERSSASQAAKEQKLGGNRTVFEIPEGMELWRPEKAGTYYLDIMEYPVGKYNPVADEGMAFHSRCFWIHWGVGVNNQPYACLAKNWDKPCPVCEEWKRLDKDPEVDQETVDSLQPKQRQLFVVVNTDDRSKGLQLFEDSYHSLGRTINDRINNINDDPKAKQKRIDAWERFYYWDEGSTLRIEFQNKQIGQEKTWRHAANVELVERDEQYEESIVDEVPCLDDLLIELPYDELKAILHQTQEPAEDDEGEEDEREERPLKGSSKSNHRINDDENEDDRWNDDDGDLEDEDDPEPDGADTPTRGSSRRPPGSRSRRR